ncbi:MAG: hypothetical protein EU547_00585 [Promethearchaeota archaeon]|nr:MAG: hypothetical protein EU547_00585 [Candidatus Lokiarchaeota archaeon]
MEIILFLLGIIQMGFCWFNLTISSIKYHKTRNKIFLILIIGFIIVLVNAVSILIISFFNYFVSKFEFVINMSYQIFGITGMGTFFLTYIFLELLYFERLQVFTLIFMSSLFSGYLFTTFLPISYEFYFDPQLGMYYFQYTGFVKIIMFAFVISVFTYFLIILWKIKRLAKDRVQIRALRFFMTGLVVTVFGLIFFTFINHREWVIIFNSLGLFLLGISFYQHPNLVFLNPNDLYYLTITNKDGITIYSKEFHEGFLNINEDLLSGALSALSSVFMDLLQSSEYFDHIKMNNRTILFQNFKNLLVVLIVRRSSYLLNQILISFSHVISEKYQHQLEHWTGNMMDFEEIDLILKDYLPFINLGED